MVSEPAVGKLLRSLNDKRESYVAPAGTSAFLPHVVILLPNGSGLEELLGGLGNNARVTLLEPKLPIPKLEPVDVALLHANSLSLASGSLLCDPELGCPELVFVVDDWWSPQHLALKSRGFRYVVSREILVQWFPGVLAELAALAWARRVVLKACAGGPSAPPAPAGMRQARGIRLHAAETAFRDVFLRSLLAEHGSRRKAALEAGVPYRSFCEMLRKLGI